MAQTIPRCVNHPDVETRLSCSTCGDPICTRCMRQGAVGQKCPRCARVPRGARGIGKPKHYLRGAAAGGAAAVVGGIVGSQIFGLGIPFVGFFLPALLGFGVGRAVSWGVERQTTQPFVTMAAVLGAVAVAVAYGIGIGLVHPFALIGLAIGGFAAVRGLSR